MIFRFARNLRKIKILKLWEGNWSSIAEHLPWQATDAIPCREDDGELRKPYLR